MADKTMYMTEIGFSKLRSELARLKDEELPELAVYLHEASIGGDTMDNTELMMLMEQYSIIENRVLELTDILNHGELIKRGEPDRKVHLGNTVIIQMNGDAPETYTIVGSTEADPNEGMISNESPLGSALLDHAVGDDVTVNASDGVMQFRIIAVT